MHRPALADRRQSACRADRPTPRRDGSATIGIRCPGKPGRGREVAPERDRAHRRNPDGRDRRRYLPRNFHGSPRCTRRSGGVQAVQSEGKARARSQCRLHRLGKRLDVGRAYHAEVVTRHRTMSSEAHRPSQPMAGSSELVQTPRAGCTNSVGKPERARSRVAEPG